MIDLSLSELIVTQRKRLRLSQSDLAESAGVSRNYVSMIERGHIENVSYGVLSSICNRLGLVIQIAYQAERRNVGEFTEEEIERAMAETMKILNRPKDEQY